MEGNFNELLSFSSQIRWSRWLNPTFWRVHKSSITSVYSKRIPPVGIKTIMGEILSWNLNLLTVWHFVEIYVKIGVVFKDDKGAPNFKPEYTKFFCDLSWEWYQIRTEAASAIALAWIMWARKMCKIDPIFHPNFVSQFRICHSQVKDVFECLYSSYLDTCKNIKLKSKQLVQMKQKKMGEPKERDTNFNFPLRNNRKKGGSSSSLVNRKATRKEKLAVNGSMWSSSKNVLIFRREFSQFKVQEITSDYCSPN